VAEEIYLRSGYRFAATANLGRERTLESRAAGPEPE
jgi:hypothetical protein